jgi:hypothetical protein
MLNHLKIISKNKFKDINSYTLGKLNMGNEFVKFKYLDTGDLQVNTLSELNCLQLDVDETRKSLDWSFDGKNVKLEFEAPKSLTKTIFDFPS